MNFYCFIRQIIIIKLFNIQIISAFIQEFSVVRISHHLFDFAKIYSACFPSVYLCSVTSPPRSIFSFYYLSPAQLLRSAIAMITYCSEYAL